ncbi:MAG: hypothetical protein DHS20C14_18490 [Phycisphaeraceae bacterium]|nr:MAG: hypothetical protein DHS20C14_18490 [Phycisphaeraceae bacterium]
MRALTACIVGSSVGVCLGAPVDPFTETFNADNSSWADVDSNPATWAPAGGPDGSGFITTGIADLSLANPQSGFLLFRGEEGLGSSGGAFAGDYLAGNITEVSFDVRLLGPGPASFYVRLAGPAGAFILLEFAPAAPGTWQTVTFDFSASNPGYIPEGPPGPGLFNAVAPDVDRFQIGMIPAGPQTGSATVQIDNVRLIPTPASAALLGLGGLVAVRRRR